MPEQSSAEFRNSRNRRVIFPILLLVLLALIIACLCVGKYQISPGECIRILIGKFSGTEPSWDAMDENMLIGVRMPRVMASVIVGAALALSGAVYQGIFKNPLVSPDFLGVSSGACVGAATAILLSFSSVMIQITAFAGGLLAVAAQKRIGHYAGACRDNSWRRHVIHTGVHQIHR